MNLLHSAHVAPVGFEDVISVSLKVAGDLGPAAFASFVGKPIDGHLEDDNGICPGANQGDKECKKNSFH
jgi:hypothetical protein